MSQKLKIYKLHYSGEVESIDDISENIIQLFSTVSVLSIYVELQKRLYTWIGSHASRTLKNYIVQMREIFTRDYFDLRILRYITVESQSEPYDFFENTGINKEKLHEHIQKHEDKLTPVLVEIDQLKSKQDRFFEAEEYDKAIEIAYEIIELAKKIEDLLLEKDQEDFIRGARYKAEINKIIIKIEDESEIISDKVKKSQNSTEIVELHKIVEDFYEKYKDYINLPELENVRKILSYEKVMWQEFSVKLKDIEKLSQFESNIKEALNQNNLKKSLDILEESRKIVEIIKDDEIAQKWADIEADYNRKWRYFNNQIAEFERLIEENQKKENFEETINNCEQLINIGKEYNDNELVEKYQHILNENIEKLKEVETKKQIELEAKGKELDDFKEIISDLCKKAIEALNKGLIITSNDLYNEIISKISDFNK